jgi:hypothetical protein
MRTMIARALVLLTVGLGVVVALALWLGPTDPLTSPDVATWREAAVRRGLEGPSALPGLEALANKPENTDRVRLVLDIAFRQSVHLKDLEPFPRLKAIASGPLDAARTALVPNRKPLSTTNGFFVPVALERLESGTPEEQLLAMGVLSNLRATIAVPLLQQRTTSLAKASVWTGDSSIPASSGKEATRAIEGLTRTLPEVPCLHVEQELILGGAGWDLVNAVRQLPAGLAATTSEGYWEVARPLWKTWWRLAGDAGVPDRAAWLDAMNARERFRLERHVQPRGHSLVHLRGPAEVHCTLGNLSPAPVTTTLPFDHEGDPLEHEMVALRCGDDGGVFFDQQLVFEAGDELTVTFLETPEP